VALTHTWLDPNIMAGGQLTAGRVWASVLGIAMTSLAALLLRASHPPAGSTSLLVTLGAFSTKQDAYDVVAGVLIVACAGEILRRLRLRRTRLFPAAEL
jgi:CBS-domain-containing membrane protein